MTRSIVMKLVALGVVIAACGEPSTPPVRNAAATPSIVPLPADDTLGILGVAPARDRDLGSWLPAGATPFLVEAALREGKGPPPSWLATDTAGARATLAYGAATKIQYGCDGNQLTVTALDGDGAELRPGLLWLRPVGGPAAIVKPLAIADRGKPAAARRAYTIGPVTLELVRIAPKLGKVSFAWHGKPVHALDIERHDMEGADNAVPMDFVDGGVAVPVPEAAWELDGSVALIALRVPSYEGTALRAVVVNADTGREVEPMGIYLYQCAF